jgi:Calpain family cysteine protease
MVNNRDYPVNDTPVNGIDPLALVEALLGRKIDRSAMASALGASDLHSGYDTLIDLDGKSNSSDKEPQPDDQPKNVRVGCINPYALVEALVGRKMDRCSITSARIISDVLATDYDELFDMKYNSVLHAGLRLNEDRSRAEQLSEKDMKIMKEQDLETPDLSRVRKVEDLEKLGLKDILQTDVKMARMQNGKLRMVLHARAMGKTVSNRDVTMSINELALPFRKNKGEWNPPNTSLRDMYQTMFQCIARRMAMGMEMLNIGERFRLGERMLTGRNMESFESHCMRHHQFDDPVQGAIGNSWLIAAIFSVYWADPSAINRCIQPIEYPERENGRDRDEKNRRLSIKFHDKGGDNNAPTATVEVNYKVPINNSDEQPVYCRSSSGCSLWPSLYEKAFAKWITGTDSEQPDLTRTHSGDPIKAMAQINGKRPEYYFTDKRSGRELVGLVRACSVNFKTINPMCAYTHASGDMYRGSNLVANHAYSVVGWSELGQRQHVIVRNPWGVTEHPGLTSYPGILDRVEPDFWSPATLLDCSGVLAVEASAFKEYFACIGVAK